MFLSRSAAKFAFSLSLATALSVAAGQPTAFAQNAPKPLIDPPVLLDQPSPGRNEAAQQVSTPSEPYRVYVAQEDSFARCGPSGEFYRTDPLSHGQVLDVYVEAADGWLGIRPPVDSFCWVPADAINIRSGSDQGEVIEDNLVAWIGTHLGRARRYKWQVQLAKKETVTVIGKSQREGPDGPQTWYRIVPPSGEFRWVHSDQIVDSPQALIASVRKTDSRDVRFLSDGGYRANRDETRLAAVGDELQPRSRPRSSQYDQLLGDFNGNRDFNGDRDATNDSLVPIANRDTSDDAANEVVGSGVKREQRIHGVEHGHGGALGNVSEKLRDAMASAAEGLSNLSMAGASESDSRDSGIDAQFRSRPLLRDIAPETTVANTDGVPSSKMGSGGSWQSSGIRASERLNPSQVSVIPNAANDLGTVGFDSVGHAGGGVIQASGFGPYSQPPRPLGSPIATPYSPAGYTTPARPLDSVSVPPGSFGSTLMPSTPPTLRPMRSVTTEQIIRVETQVRDADAASLQLIFSRLMSERASAAEAEPVRVAARRTESLATDREESHRAKLIADRVTEYQEVARRRDGETVIRSGDSPSVPSSIAPTIVTPTSIDSNTSSVTPQPSPLGRVPMTPLPGFEPTPSRPNGFLVTGQLVQVYSARPNSPPYALTDNQGRTIAYVTPAPGTSLHNHLNSEIHLAGTQGFLQGIKTPHIVASGATRVQ